MECRIQRLVPLCSCLSAGHSCATAAHRTLSYYTVPTESLPSHNGYDRTLPYHMMPTGILLYHSCYSMALPYHGCYNRTLPPALLDITMLCYSVKASIYHAAPTKKLPCHGALAETLGIILNSSHFLDPKYRLLNFFRVFESFDVLSLTISVIVVLV